jgi:NitT/TauT family transport system ATP-binding protein
MTSTTDAGAPSGAVTADAIECRDIVKTFPTRDGGVRTVLDHASFTAGDGEFVCILGPSGCGKSTFLNILSGLDTRFEGTARVHGIDVRSPEIARIRSSYIFQEARLLPWRTVGQNLELVLQASTFRPSEWPARIDHHLEMVGLLDFKDYHPNQLSGGMQQRASIARAFCVEPDVLYMDEPFSALDELSARKLRQDLLDIWSAQRTTVVFVTHNALEATFLADRILIMKRGPESTFRDEVDLADLPRPRSSDAQDVFDRSRDVVGRLIGIVGDSPED